MNILFTIKNVDINLIKEMQAHLYSEWAWKCLNDNYPGDIVLQYLESKEDETTVILNGTEDVLLFAEENVCNFLIKKDINFDQIEDSIPPYKVKDTVIFKR